MVLAEGHTTERVLPMRKNKTTPAPAITHAEFLALGEDARKEYLRTPHAAPEGTAPEGTAPEGTDGVQTTTPAPTTDELVAQLVARRDALTAELQTVSATLATYRVHHLVTSVVEKPVALVRRLFLEDPTVKRGTLIHRLVNMGVAPNTAKTQYQILRTKYLAGDLDGDLEELRGDVGDYVEMGND